MLLAPFSVFWSDTVGIAFAFFVILPALATVLIVVAVVTGRGEKRDNEQHAGRWGTAAKHSDE